MSESDDTDVLLLIPPDLFLVPSSDSEDSEFQEKLNTGPGGPGVVSELIEHVQSLETRISLIESKDTSLDASFLNNSVDSHPRTSYHSPLRHNQQQPRSKFASVSQLSSLSNTPVKPRRISSVPSTPGGYQPSSCINQSRHDTRRSAASIPHRIVSAPSTPYGYQPSNCTNHTRHDTRLSLFTPGRGDTNTLTTANPHPRNKHDDLTSSFSEPSVVSSAARYSDNLHASAVSLRKETRSATDLDDNAMSKSHLYHKSFQQSSFSLPSANSNQKPAGRYHSEQRPVREMELSEVDELLHEMEATEIELAKRINDKSSYQRHQEKTNQQDTMRNKNITRFRDTETEQKNMSPVRKLDFQSYGTQSLDLNNLQQNRTADKFPDISLPFDEDSLQLDETDKMISEFKTWQQNSCKSLPRNSDRYNVNYNVSESVENEPARQLDRRSNGFQNKNMEIDFKTMIRHSDPQLNTFQNRKVEGDQKSMNRQSDTQSNPFQNRNVEGDMGTTNTQPVGQSNPFQDRNVEGDPRTMNRQLDTQSNPFQNRIVESDVKTMNMDALASTLSAESTCIPSSSSRSNVDLAQPSTSELAKSHVSMHSTQAEATQLPQTSRNSHSTSNLQSTIKEMHAMPSFNMTNRTTSHVATNTEPSIRKSQRLLALSDFWENDSSKSQEEMLRIKLEEEKFRREHCEHLIQELQKRLLEQQEKVAVAVRVDNEKNVVITQFQNAWTRLKLRWQVLEAEQADLQLTLKNITEKHQMEMSEFQSQIKRCEGELSKALDLAAGYKEKSDAVVKEKLELLRSHADELEKYKSLVQEAESRYSQLKGEYGKILEQNQQLGEAVKSTQQEVNRERLRGGEVRAEMAVIHKALDACEAELTVLRQEKENLQLKLREELNRNSILEQNKSSYLTTIEEAKKAERMAKEETNSLAEQQEKIRTELREVYQKQVDDVVKAKLQEFQAQLDAAEAAFQTELESRQRAIAECAARKIKSVLDKHQLEINLLEEKQKEEKRLCGIQLAQAMQQSSILETQLNTQRATKTQLAEQLHSVMQKQWQQALHIISGGNTENLSPLQRINAEKFFEAKQPKRSDSIPNICGKVYMEPMRLESQSMPAMDIRNFPNTQSREDHDESLVTITSPEETPLTSRRDQSKDDLRRYIKMILDMQQPKPEFIKPTFSENSPSSTPIRREVPRKHYTKKEESLVSDEGSIIWQPTSEVSVQDMTEISSVPQKLTTKGDQQKNKPPWK